MTSIQTPLDIAAAHWAPLPDWVKALAAACTHESQSAVAAKIGRSQGLISQVLRARYPGNLNTVEELVRGAFMDAKVDCPSLGSIDLLTCRTWRDRAKSPSLHNPTRVMMAKACRDCAHFQKDQRT